MKSLAAVGVLAALGSAPALAVESTTTGDSSLIVTVFDPVLGASVVQDLGLNYSQFLEGAVTPDTGLTLNFSVDMSVFQQVGSNLNNLRYTVFAGDGTGNYTQTGVMVTAALGLSAVPGTNQDVVNILSSSAAAQMFNSWASNCGAASTTCTGTGFGSTYYGGTSWGERFGNNLDVSGAGALNEALGFYYLTRTAITTGQPLNSLTYANVTGPAQWLLSSTGTLTYSVAAAPVPLPAAAWLFLSGLAGLGVVGRRKARA